MRLFNFSLRLNGYPINKAKRSLTEIQVQSDTAFIVFVEGQKRKILDFHLLNNPFYKSLIGNRSIEEWNSVPVMTKHDLQRPLSERLSNGFNPKNVYVNKTSGSSGDPFIFAKDKWCHAMTWAMIMDRFSWYNIDFNYSKQARFYGIPLDKKGYYKERIKDFFSQRFRFSVFDLSTEAFESCLQKFSSTPFVYINGYTSPIVQFAKFLRAKNVILKDVCPSLTVCMVTSEMLFEDDKELLESQFNIPVINEYGASELDLIAFQNPNGDFQLNSETLFIEVLNDQNESVPIGQEGRIVITSLFNKAHPFIRYDIGDIGVISKNSTTKKPILKKLIGRTNDIAVLPSGRKAAGLTFYYITKSIIEDDGNVKEFIIEQFTVSNFKISYISDQALTKVEEDVIKKEMGKYLEPGLDITFERRKIIERSSNGKLKQFATYLNLNE